MSQLPKFIFLHKGFKFAFPTFDGKLLKSDCLSKFSENMFVVLRMQKFHFSSCHHLKSFVEPETLAINTPMRNMFSDYDWKLVCEYRQQLDKIGFDTWDYIIPVDGYLCLNLFGEVVWISDIFAKYFGVLEYDHP